MKQLLIAKSTEALNTTSIASLNPGALCIVRLKDGAIIDGSTATRAKLQAGKNVCIALGRPAGRGEINSGSQQNNLIIPEIDTNTLSIVKAMPTPGSVYKRAFTVPSISAVTVNGASVYPNIGVIIAKGGTVPNERFRWHATVQATGTPATDATNLKTAIDGLGLPITVSRSTAKLTITANNINEVWNVVLTDAISTTAFSSTSSDISNPSPAIGSTAYVKDLALQCAGDKGHFYTNAEAREFIPGYPDDVEITDSLAGATDVSSVSSSTVSDGDIIRFTGTTAGSYINGHYYSVAVESTTVTPTELKAYAIYTLRFQVGRNSAKTRDEKVWQLVHIAVPTTMASDGMTTLDTIFADFM